MSFKSPPDWDGKSDPSYVIDGSKKESDRRVLIITASSQIDIVVQCMRFGKYQDRALCAG